ncbi:ABC transporter permease [Pseudomonas sp. B6002]|uniref:ABC transporter permease n=1 Tax=Pseudomonas sp. B6002 TaxID=2726978 RepID=UPI0015A12379|nr:ABC transporter permease [Pseudomonas sp. B6002]NVZ53259.1 ABC transporter permease [Pseudomonas sp. B6002]
MKLTTLIFKHHLTRCAYTPSIYLHISVFLALSAALGLLTNLWLDKESSNLQVFFEFHPWLYLWLIPALSMQLWADEYNRGFSELIQTLPMTAADQIVGKFLAGWTLSGIALILTFPVIIAANLLGSVDSSVVFSQYISSWLLAGSYLSVGCFVCTLTHRRTLTPILTISLLLAATGLSCVLDALEHQTPIWLIDSLTTLDVLIRFGAVDNGKLTLHDGLYFISMILAFLSAATVTLNAKNS